MNIEGLRRLFLLGRKAGTKAKLTAEQLSTGAFPSLNRVRWTPGRLVCRVLLLSLVIKLGANVLEWTRPTRPHARQQVLAKAELDEQSNHLIIVSYSPEHSLHDEYVYNQSDIDNSHVVWARDMGPEKNERLIQYFSDRKIWRWHVADDDTASWERVISPLSL